MNEINPHEKIRLWNLRKHWFWTSFWPNFAGIIVGVPVALWLNSYAASVSEKAQEAEEQQRLRDGLGVVQAAIEFNRAKLQEFADTLESGRVPYDLGLDVSAWEAAKGEVVPYLGNSDLQRQLAYHFAQLASLTRVNDLFLDQVVGVPSALGNSGQTRASLHNHLKQETQTLIVEAQELAQELGTIRKSSAVGGS